LLCHIVLILWLQACKKAKQIKAGVPFVPLFAGKGSKRAKRGQKGSMEKAKVKMKK